MLVKYIILNSGGSPIAAVNRCKFLSSGLEELGVKSSIKVIGSENGNKFILKFFFAIRYLFIITYLLLTTKASGILIFYGHFPGLSFFKLIRRKRYSIVAERNEYPVHIMFKDHKLKKGAIERSENYCKNLNFFDGFITCTNNLKMFYEPFLKRNCRVQIIPSVVDSSKFRIVDFNKKNNYITYCGDWSNSKDGVQILIRAFYLLSKNNKEFKLRLVGGTNNIRDKKKILDLIDNLNLREKIILEGRVDHSLIPALLNESKILVLARPANKQAEGGFPSKVTEYLATGVPTLVTRVGEIEKYFTNNLNIYLSEPDSPEDFSNKLNFIIQNYSIALSVAEKGRIKNKEFDYKYQAGRLSPFLEGLLIK